MANVQNYWQGYFKNVSYSWMENWYDDLKELTIHSTYFKLTKEECNELLKLVDGDANPETLKLFIDKLRDYFREFKGNRVFVRLGSRSPKDNETEIREPKDILQAFSDSERILEDLMLCLNIGYLPYLFIREWVDMPRSREFRCIVKEGKLRGITQYFYREKYYYLNDGKTRAKIRIQADKLLKRIIKKFPYRNFVFDILYRGEEQLPLLIEINPYSNWTDSCLFDWAIDKFDKYQFKWLQSLERGEWQ